MSSLTRLLEPGGLMRKIDPVEAEMNRDHRRWVGGSRSETTPYSGPAQTGEGMGRAAVAPLGRRSTVIAGQTRRTSLLGY